MPRTRVRKLIIYCAALLPTGGDLRPGMRKQANKLFWRDVTPVQERGKPLLFFCMYRALRACAFIYHQGDDFEEHSQLPLNLPKDFDPPINWQNRLKNARLLRNRADYEAYPKSDASWRRHAVAIKNDADELLSKTRIYLSGKGCPL